MFKKPKNINKSFYLIWSIIYPIVYRNKFKNIDIIKANQLSGSWVGIPKIYTKKATHRKDWI